MIEVAPRKGAGTSFRFPDKNVRKANMDLQRQHYPSGAIGTTSHFCGLPRGVTWAFKLCKPFMAKETYDNMKLKPNFNHLPKYLPPASILKAWGGVRIILSFFVVFVVVFLKKWGSFLGNE